MHSPLGIPAQANVLPTGIEPGVNAAERLWDALAMLLIIAGTALFIMARNGLASIANGTDKLPPGMTSFIQRSDYFSAQSSLGMGLIGIGVAVGLAAAIRHAVRRRTRRSAAGA